MRRPSSPSKDPAGGFTLLEVLVALGITALFFSMALPAVGTSLARLSQAQGSIEALTLARSVLADHADTSLREGRYEGRQGGLSWRADVTRESGSNADLPFALRRVEVEVFQGRASMQKLVLLVVAPVHD